LPLRGNPDL